MVLKQSMFLKPRERVLTCRMMPLSPSRINVGAPMAEVGEDVLPVPAELSGEGLHRFRPRMHHPRAQCLGPGLPPPCGSALSAWMSCRRSRIPHALAVFDRRFAGSRLTSGCGSVRLDSFPGHRHFVLFSRPFSLASALRTVRRHARPCPASRWSRCAPSGRRRR